MRGVAFLPGLVFAVLAPAVHAAEVNRSWDVLVETLKPGRSAVVIQQNRKQVEGKVLSLGPESITVRVRGQPLTVVREEVFRVRYANIRRRHTLIGMAVGAATGAIIWGLAGRDNRDVGGYALGGAILGVGPGAAVGGALPIGVPQYEAPGGLRKSKP